MRLPSLVAGALALGACAEAPRDGGAEEPPPAGRDAPPHARLDLLESLREDLAAERHPSDGGGRAWIEGERTARVGVPGRWRIVYEAGPLGVADGGLVALLVDPFWSWSTPQVELESRSGFTHVSTEASGVELVPSTLDGSLLGIEVRGRALQEGERVTIHYGAGPAGSQPDRFAEREARFWIRVDGDGDGVMGLVLESPTLDVAPGEPAALALTLPSTARTGEPVRLTAAVLDGRANALWELAGELVVTAAPETAELERQVALESTSGGRTSLEVVFREPGLYVLGAEVRPEGGGAPLASFTNPCLVLEDQPRILWADLHGHSNLSDGTGTPDDFYRYARDVAGLDAAALTDHDHWGVRFLDQSPDLWDEIRASADRFHEPGRFVTLHAYEWTSWIHGHRHVLYFEEGGDVHSSVDPATDSPQELWDALRGQDALTFAHHSAGGPVPTDWSFPPDPVLEPVTEIVSVHGSSEAPDSPAVIYDPIPGNFVRDVLDRGYRLGFIGSGDGHDGHPGHAHLLNPSGGLAAILAEELTRESLLEALRERRCYATNGPRILLRTSLGGRRMGSEVEAAALTGPAKLVFLAVGTAPLESLEIIRSGEVLTLDPEGELQVSGEHELAGLTAGEYVYVRAVQADGGAAWSSPFFLR